MLGPGRSKASGRVQIVQKLSRKPRLGDWAMLLEPPECRASSAVVLRWRLGRDSEPPGQPAGTERAAEGDALRLRSGHPD